MKDVNRSKGRQSSVQIVCVGVLAIIILPTSINIYILHAYKTRKANYIKYKNKLITKITKNRAIVKPVKEPLAHEVSQSEFCIFFQLLITETV